MPRVELRRLVQVEIAAPARGGVPVTIPGAHPIPGPDGDADDVGRRPSRRKGVGARRDVGAQVEAGPGAHHPVAVPGVDVVVGLGDGNTHDVGRGASARQRVRHGRGVVVEVVDLPHRSRSVTVERIDLAVAAGDGHAHDGGGLAPAVEHQQLSLDVDAEAVRVGPGHPVRPGRRMAVGRAQPGVGVADRDQARVEPQEPAANGVVGLLPAQGSGQHPASGSVVVLGDPVVLTELLAVLDHRRGRGGEQRDGPGLGLDPPHGAGVVPGPGLPRHVGVIVVAEVDRRHLVCRGEVPLVVEHVHHPGRPGVRRPGGAGPLRVVRRGLPEPDGGPARPHPAPPGAQHLVCGGRRPGPGPGRHGHPVPGQGGAAAADVLVLQHHRRPTPDRRRAGSERSLRRRSPQLTLRGLLPRRAGRYPTLDPRRDDPRVRVQVALPPGEGELRHDRALWIVSPGDHGQAAGHLPRGGARRAEARRAVSPVQAADAVRVRRRQVRGPVAEPSGW